MTATVTAATRTIIASGSYETLSATIGIVAILLLLVLLIEKELMRAAGGPRLRIGVQALNIVITPLLLMFTLILVMRLASIWH